MLVGTMGLLVLVDAGCWKLSGGGLWRFFVASFVCRRMEDVGVLVRGMREEEG